MLYKATLGMFEDLKRLSASGNKLSALGGSCIPAPSSSTTRWVVVSTDLMLDAATESQFHDGSATTAGSWPCYHTCVTDAAATHRYTEDSREARKESCLSATWKASSMPASLSADFALESLVKTRTPPGVVHTVDVEMID
jgi:hypothetical protein